jgi:hypothetical protein
MNVIDYACRVQDRRNGITPEPNANIEALVALAESDLPQAERMRQVAEWRRLKLL